MENTTPKKHNRQYFLELINAIPGFTQIPNWILALELSKHALLVLWYLMRLANPKKGNTCYPSIKNVCKNCKITGESTVRSAINELIETELITKKTIGRGNVYKIEEVVYLAFKKAPKKDSPTSELEATPPACNGIESSGNGNLPTAPAYNGTPPQCDTKHRQHTTTNNIKLTKITNNTKEKEKEANPTNLWDSGVREDKLLGANGMKNQKAPVREKPNTFAEADQYFKALTQKEKTAYDVRAYNLSPYISSSRTRRRRFFEELSEVHTVRREDEQVFTIPAEAQTASEPIGGLQ